MKPILERKESDESPERRSTFSASNSRKANISLQTLRSHAFQENLLSDIRFAVAVRVAKDALNGIYSPRLHLSRLKKKSSH